MRLSTRLELCAMLTASGCTVWGCSAGYRSAYESDLHFEHCYRLDEELNVTIAQKRACWQRFTRTYARAQSQDRLQYALIRERALATANVNGGTDPHATGMHQLGNDLGHIGGAPSADDGLTSASPMPTSAFAPPPATLAVDAGGSSPVPSVGAGRANGQLTAAPGARCITGCGKEWLGCGQACRIASCRAMCDETYRSCMKGCF
jgi:hypothetical protein